MQHTPAPSEDPIPQTPVPYAATPAPIAAEPAEEEAMTILGLQIESFQRIQVAKLEPSPTGLVFLRGANEQGKSSIIEAILDALGEEKSTSPIHTTHHKSDVKIDLGPLVIFKRYTKDADGKKVIPKVTLETADGSKVRGTPAKVLKTLRGFFADPGAFLDLPAMEQVKIVLGVLGLADKLDELEDRHEGSYDRRRDLGRDVTQRKKAVDEMQITVDRLPSAELSSSIEELTGQLQQSNAHNSEINREIASRSTVESQGSDIAASITIAESHIIELQGLLDAANANLRSLKTRKESVGALWQAANERIKSMVLIDVTPITTALQAHEEASKHAGKRELLVLTKKQLEDAVVLHEAEEETLAGIRQEIANLLSETKFPVPGMSFDPKEKLLMIGELPFSAASQGQQLKAATAIAMAGNPRLKIIFIRQASLLDQNAQMLLSEIALANKYQVWMELVDMNPDGDGIWVQDGFAYQHGKQLS